MQINMVMTRPPCDPQACQRLSPCGVGGRLGAAALLLAIWAPSLSHAAHVADRIIAVVNSEVITLSELKAEIEPEEGRLRERYRGPELDRRLRQLEYAGLTRMIERRLQMQVAQVKGVDVSDEELAAAVRELKRQGEKIDDTNPREKQFIREQRMLMKVVDREVRSGVMVSSTELTRYYDTHRARFLLPDEYRISQILIQPRSGESMAEARKKAAEVHAALQQGKDFGDLALRHSSGTEAARGGALGFVRQGELLPPIERALASLLPGLVSEPVETPLGLHIIRLDEKRPAQFRPFSEVKVEIHNLVAQQKSEDVYQAWIGELKDKAYINIKLF